MNRCPGCGDRLDEATVWDLDNKIVMIDQALCARPVCRQSPVPQELRRAAEAQWLSKQWSMIQEVLFRRQ